MLMGTLPPPETRPNIYLRETPQRVIGLQTGTARAKLRFALRIAVGATDDCRRRSRQRRGESQRAERGSAPLPPYPPGDAPEHPPDENANGREARSDQHSRAFDVYHHNASKHDRAGALTCTERMRVADYNLVLY